MATYSAVKAPGGRYRTPRTRANTRQGIADLVKQIEHKSTSRSLRDYSVDHVMHLVDGGAVNDRHELVETVRRIVDPERTGRRHGAPGADPDAEKLASSIEGKIAATAALQDDRHRRKPPWTIPDDAYIWVRESSRATRLLYAAAQPAFVQHHEYGNLHAPTSIGWLVEHASNHVLTLLGFWLIRHEEPPT